MERERGIGLQREQREEEEEEREREKERKRAELREKGQRSLRCQDSVTCERALQTSPG